jgi:hypothetical protein
MCSATWSRGPPSPPALHPAIQFWRVHPPLHQGGPYRRRLLHDVLHIHIWDAITSIKAFQFLSRKFLFLFGDMLGTLTVTLPWTGTHLQYFAFRAAASPLRLLVFVVTTSSGHPASSPRPRPWYVTNRLGAEYLPQQKWRKTSVILEWNKFLRFWNAKRYFDPYTLNHCCSDEGISGKTKTQWLNFRTIYGGSEPSRIRVVVPARQATLAGRIFSLESISGILESLKIPYLGTQ